MGTLSEQNLHPKSIRRYQEHKMKNQMETGLCGEGQLLTWDEVVELARSSKPTIRREVDAGNLIPTRIRGRLLFHPNDVDDWLARCRGVAKAVTS
jgi:excisionase family DNA binding protein